MSRLSERLRQRRTTHRRDKVLEKELARIPAGSMRDEILELANRRG